MSNEESPYGVYLRFYLGMREGRKLSSINFFNSGNFVYGVADTPFTELQTVAATMAIEDFQSGIQRRTRKSFVEEVRKITS